MINWFKRNIGEDFVSKESASKVVYNSDASQIEGNTVLVVRPGNAKEVHQSLLFVKRNHSSITVRGGGTGLVGSCVPENSVVMDMSRMNKILSIDKDYVVVEPGIILDDLNEKLGDKFFPVVPSSSKSCTIGGMIACNAVGTKAIKYGKTGNWIREIEIIDGDGRHRKAELKDIVGKEGVTGVIISAKLRIIDKPKKVNVELLGFETIDDMMFKLRELEDVNAVEFISKKASKFLDLKEKNYLLIEKDSDVNIGLDLWEMRDGLYPQLAKNGYVLIEDPKVPLEKMEKFLKWLEENEIPSFGHIMAGIIHPCFMNDIKLDELYEKVEDFNGEISGEHGIGMRKKQYTSKEFRANIKNLKNKYDRDNIINRGKLI
ncbi:MAG: FAD-binding oxidoreductase [Nanoarchaeota archaeon]|nr:FAD-binding oxidoreductase [Nanoarchaeota archaeon]